MAKIIEPGVLLDKIGLDEISLQRRKLSNQISYQYIRQQLGTSEHFFTFLNLGTLEIPIHNTLHGIQNIPSLSVPRTGHLGSWQEIAAGRAGGVNYDKIICKDNRFGYPLIYDLNFTEDSSLKFGDSAYLPGSYISNGTRNELPLYTWNGSAFTKSDRSEPLFSPFVLTPFGDELISLVQFHRHHFSKIHDYQFRFISNLIEDNKLFVRKLLIALIEEAYNEANPESSIRELFDYSVSLDGKLGPAPIALEDGTFTINGYVFKNPEALADASLLPILVASSGAVELITQFPTSLPLLSSALIVLLLAFLSSDYPNTSISLKDYPGVHLHWGALRMAGFPPEKKGYFAKNINNYRKLFNKITAACPEMSSLFYILFPCSIFLLWPNNTFSADIEYIVELIKKIHIVSDHLIYKPNIAKEIIYACVFEWYQSRHQHLSQYFKNRFSPNVSILNKEKMLNVSDHIEPTGFRELSWMQACLTVGALSNTIVNKPL